MLKDICGSLLKIEYIINLFWSTGGEQKSNWTVNSQHKIKFVNQTEPLLVGYKIYNFIAWNEREIEKLINHAVRTLIQMAKSQNAPDIV